MSSARFQDVPVPRRDIVVALLEHAGRSLDADDVARLRSICELLINLYHFEFHAELEAMKRAYAPFNPDLDDARFDVVDTPTPERAALLGERLRSVLERGNYERLTEDDVHHAFTERSLFPLAVVVDTSIYEEIMIYARGETRRHADVPRWYGLRRRTIDVPTFDRVCLYVRLKSPAQLGLSPAKLARQRFEPGTTILKLFRNIPSADLEILFPNCEPQMRVLDKLFFGVPALLGGIPVIAKLAPATFALAVLLGLRRGQIDTASIIAGLSGLIVLGAYLFRQWGKFRNRRLLFSKELSENLYFRNLDNNEGVLTRLVDEAEEEECKEALLAYVMLSLCPDANGLDIDELDRRIEDWLAQRFDVAIDFEIGDALAKLERLELVTRDGRQIVAHPPAEAVTRLRARWDALV